MLMSFVVDDHAFNVDQKLPAEERGPATYPNTLPESFTKYGVGVWVGALPWGLRWLLPAPLRAGCGRRRFLQEQRMACEVGLYYVLHVAKQRNKNALLRLLPGLGESAGRAWAPPAPRRGAGPCKQAVWVQERERPCGVLSGALCARHHVSSCPQW